MSEILADIEEVAGDEPAYDAIGEIIARVICAETTGFDPDSRPLRTMTMYYGGDKQPTATWGRPEWKNHVSTANAVVDILARQGFKIVAVSKNGGARFGRRSPSIEQLKGEAT